MSQTDKILYNGIAIPCIAFGPGSVNYRKPGASVEHPSRIERLWTRIRQQFVGEINPLDAYIQSISNGIKAGFRLIDYSSAYGDSSNIAKAIALSGIERDRLFLTGRISNKAQFEGKDGVRHQIDEILTGYKTDHLDLLMFHWPVTGFYEGTWTVLCDAYEKGIARSIGVANCHVHHLKRIMDVGYKPMINQFEVHPLFTQKPLIAFCNECGIQVEAYTPLARFDDRLIRLPALKAIAERQNKSTAQVILRWHVQQGRIPIVKSRNEERQREDFNIFDFELTDEELNKIDSFNINARIRYDPDNCDFSIL